MYDIGWLFTGLLELVFEKMDLNVSKFILTEFCSDFWSRYLKNGGGFMYEDTLCGELLMQIEIGNNQGKELS